MGTDGTGFPPLERFLGRLRRAEKWGAAAALFLAGLLPVLEMFLRGLFGVGIPGNAGYVQHLTLWVGFLGAVVATEQGRHLAISVGVMALPERWRNYAETWSTAAALAVAGALFLASAQFVLVELDTPVRLGGWLPVWAAESILPVAFALIALSLLLSCKNLAAPGLALLLAGAFTLAGVWLDAPPPGYLWAALPLVLLTALAGAPIFVVLGGLALVLLIGEGVPIAAIPVETYRIVVSPSIPTIPLFALTGYILAEGGAGERLVQVFRCWFGWLPGGMALVTALVCAFFSAFTGASGVTIIALAGLLMTVLVQNGYPENFSTGLLTATGSIGLLFPPSLAIILYGVVAHVPIPDLFRAGVVPGVMMVVGVGAYGVYIGIRSSAPRPAFDLRAAGAALWNAKWVLLLPAVALTAIFGGFATLVEAASITVAYALIIETAVHRDLTWRHDVPAILLKCVTMVGGVFVILGVAMGLTNYMIDAEIPMRGAEWVRQTIESRLVFLLVLNLFLLAVGSLMDIYSAIAVVVPLILPMGAAFGIHPLHLGIIFLINLELGYLTPPVGMNLFLAAYRFEKPVLEVTRNALPFFFILLVVLILVTYLPFLTTGVF